MHSGCYGFMETFKFEDYLQYIQKFKITRLHLVPPVLIMIAKRSETAQYNFSSVKHILCAAASLSSELQNKIMTRYQMVVSQGWGRTETTCGGILIPGMAKDTTGSIGNLLPNTEGRLVDDDGKEVVQDGEPGELWLKGPQIMLEYWKNQQATSESLTSDGWFKTGDIAVMRSGKWWIVDRKKELIKVNVLQVAPAELEAVFLEHHDVTDVAIVGVTVHGEELPRAYIVLRDNANGSTNAKDIQNFTATRVAKHKQLTGGVKFVDKIPKLASGKIMRKVMRVWAKRDAKEVEGKIKARI